MASDERHLTAKHQERAAGDQRHVTETTEQRDVEIPKRRCELFQKILATAFHQGGPHSVLASIHAVHEIQQRYSGLAKVDD